MPYLIGQYEFAPALNSAGNRVRRDGTSTDWWLIIRCADDVGRYFRYLYAQSTYHCKRLSDPLWGAHVSVVRGEEAVHKQYWKDRAGQTVRMEYDQAAIEIAEYVFFPVRCEELLDYRELLGLKRNPEFDLHLTFGNCKHV